jgi:hypothetical protein
MDVEITKTDLKTIVSKASRDNKFNAIKNVLAKDIRGYLEKGERRITTKRDSALMALLAGPTGAIHLKRSLKVLLFSRLPDQPGQT